VRLENTMYPGLKAECSALTFEVVKRKSKPSILGECNRVTSSDHMNFFDVVSVSPPVFGHFLVQTILLSNFYIKHKFSCHML
jgi:hypothetical protein